MIPSEQLVAFIQDLASPDPSARRVAAESLSDGDERAIYPLIRTLRDDNTGVQDAAMRSLVAIGGEVTAYMALPLLREGPFLRNAARVILRQIGQPSVPLLRPLLQDKDDDIRTFAVDLIADIGSCDYPADLVQVLGRDPNQNTRASAARAIGVLGFREALPALINALRDNEWVCFSALEALSAMQDEASVEPVQALLAGPSETLRYAAIETLGKLGSPKSRSILLSRLPQANDIEKTAIVKSLVQIGITPSMAEVGTLLLDMYTNGDWEERLIALSGLSSLKDKRAVPVILEIAGSLEPSDPENEDRLHAVREALMQFGCAPELVAVLSDPRMKFRSKALAIEIVAELQCAEAVPHLIAVMDTDLREVRRAAIMALAELRGDLALAELRKRIEDRDGHVRNAAIAALGRISDRGSFPLILQHIAVENYKDVLEEAIKALLTINPQALFSRRETLSPEIREMIARYAGNADILLALSRDAEPGVKMSALSSLGRLADERAHTRLVEALRDADPEARKTAVMALASRHGDPAEIGQALKDENMWVRLYAVKALGESEKPGVVPSIIPLLYDREVPVVLSAIDALVQLGSADTIALSAVQNHADPAVRERVARIMERVC
jgi:HEAT repeat protein